MPGMIRMGMKCPDRGFANNNFFQFPSYWITSPVEPKPTTSDTNYIEAYYSIQLRYVIQNP